MTSTNKRLQVLGGHFQVIHNVESTRTSSPTLVRDLGHLLEHDNHDHRKKMKEFMRGDVFIP